MSFYKVKLIKSANGDILQHVKNSPTISFIVVELINTSDKDDVLKHVFFDSEVKNKLFAEVLSEIQMENFDDNLILTEVVVDGITMGINL